MRTAAVVYRSRTGTTRRFAEEIGAHLESREIDPCVTSIGDCDMTALGKMDFVLLRCWSDGLLFARQHPAQP